MGAVAPIPAAVFGKRRASFVLLAILGARWAGMIESMHASSGAGVCEKLAGYYIVYLPKHVPPRLRVARRDVRLEWDWALRQWKEE